jgi:ATP-dependent DNA helicase RecG
MAAFNSGRIRPRRYRNRRLGDFLKELKLTEGKATGIPAILKALKNNGSPAPHFDTDEDRSFFEIELFKHEAANSLTNRKNSSNEIEGDEIMQLSDSLSSHLSPDLSLDPSLDLSLQVKDFAKILLQLESGALKKGEIMDCIGKFNNTISVRKYIEPLEKIGWIGKTIPDKPSSKHQRYALTAKGKKLLEELKK